MELEKIRAIELSNMEDRSLSLAEFFFQREPCTEPNPTVRERKHEREVCEIELGGEGHVCGITHPERT